MQDDIGRDERVDVAPQQKMGEGDNSSKSAAAPLVTDDDNDKNKDICLLLQKASPPIDWNPSTFSNITKLNLPECGLSFLPANLGTWLPNLSILFCPKNKFEELPAAIGSCPNLQMVSFKSNGMKRIHPEALQPQMRWLILTDNELEFLPSTIGRCTKLQKCMLSGNKLSSLPQEIENCHNLELIRLASNRLTEPPMELLRLPNLCWIAFSDNPFVEKSINQLVENNSLEVMENIEQHELLGRGASGVTHRATSNGTTSVAVKTYFGTMTSDGNPLQERTLSLVASTLSSPCLIQVLGQTQNGSLVMELLDNIEAFAGPPSKESCSRDVYGDDAVVNAKQAVSMVTGLLNALVKLHSRGICHGDFYGHNILVSRDDDTKVHLSDFGAAFAYDRTAGYAKYVEKIEMRALGHLVEEIAKLIVEENEESAANLKGDLKELAQACREEHSTFSKVQALWQASSAYTLA
mmetsp:Transcript_23450/g.42557  ORF Transcript_23450/g.42557 Transcript_23450/m.42557 type:complete len:465 (-) Transcript_23450:127-1521(-)